MAELGTNTAQKQFNKASEQATQNLQGLQDKANDVMQGMKDRFGTAYNSASDWMEDNSITLFAIGGGILVAGLLTYFIARRKSDSFQESVDRAA